MNCNSWVDQLSADQRFELEKMRFEAAMALREGPNAHLETFLRRTDGRGIDGNARNLDRLGQRSDVVQFAKELWIEGCGAHRAHRLIKEQFDLHVNKSTIQRWINGWKHGKDPVGVQEAAGSRHDPKAAKKSPEIVERFTEEPQVPENIDAGTLENCKPKGGGSISFLAKHPDVGEYALRELLAGTTCAQVHQNIEQLFGSFKTPARTLIHKWRDDWIAEGHPIDREATKGKSGPSRKQSPRISAGAPDSNNMLSIMKFARGRILNGETPVAISQAIQEKFGEHIASGRIEAWRSELRTVGNAKQPIAGLRGRPPFCK